MKTRRSLIAIAGAAVGWWHVASRSGSSAAPDGSDCVEPEIGSVTDGCPSPPRMLLRVPGGRSQEAGLGTWCWERGERACCVDMIGPVYPSCPVVVAAGDEIGVDFADLGVVSELTIELRRDPAGVTDGSRREARRGSGGDAIWRLAFDRPAGPLHLPAFLPPGGYVIDLFAYANGPNGGGDTSQGFRITVEPEPGHAATPTAGATPVAGAAAERPANPG